MNFSLKSFIQTLKFQEPQHRENLTIFPLLINEAEEDAPAYLLLEEALQSGELEIGELDREGRVNTIAVINHAPVPVLILDGEEVLGAKQNRMVNATILVPTKEKVEIPVSCIERGRWRYSSPSFEKTGAFGYSRLRQQKARQVMQNLKYEGGFQADQRAIWEEVDRIQARMGTISETNALHAVYEDYRDELEEFIKNLRPATGQSGIAVLINNHFVCLDIFDRPETLRKLWAKLLTSYALEAFGTREEKKDTGAVDLQAVLDMIAKAECETHPSVGLGTDLRFSNPAFIGAGLVWKDRFLHLSVFQNKTDQEHGGKMGRPGQRRHNLG